MLVLVSKVKIRRFPVDFHSGFPADFSLGTKTNTKVRYRESDKKIKITGTKIKNSLTYRD